MTYRILQTKLYMPSAENIVSRRALLDNLAHYADNKLTIVAAPGGYGKSTLVCDWLQESNLDAIWLSIDEKDNFPGIFWSYFCEGFRKYDDGIAQKATLLLQQSDNIDYCEFVDWLLEALIKLTRKRNRPPKLIIVLDDFHCISQEGLIESINRFIDYMPPWIHIAVTCRQIPDLSVSQRRSKLQLNMINREELAFDIDDTSRFLTRKLSLSLEEEQLTQLYRQTEGWAAAIQLSGLSIKAGGTISSSTSAQDSLLSDFLFEQVFCQLNGQIKDVLISLSVAPRFCAELCNSLNDFDQGSSIMDQLLAANLLLVSLDHEGKWYRFHNLFQEWLLGQLERRNDRRIEQLRASAIRWFEANQFFDEALEIALLQQDWEWAGTLFQKVYATLSQLHNTGKAEHILKQFPRSIIESRPQLALSKAIFHFAVFQYEEAGDYLDLVENKLSVAKKALSVGGRNVYSECGCSGQEDFNAIDVASKFIRSHMARFSGNTTLATTLCKEILADAKVDDSRLLCWCYCGLAADNFLNDDVVACIDYAFTALTTAKQVNDGHCVIATLGWLLPALSQNGKPRLAKKIAADSLIWLKERAMECLPDIGIFYSQLMSLQRELNQLDDAWDTYQILQNHTYDRTDPRNNINGRYIACIQLLMSCHRVDEALDLATELESYIRSNFGNKKYIAGFDIAMVQAGLHLKKGNLHPLMVWQQKIPEQYDVWGFQYENERLFYAVAEMLKGRDVLALLDAIEDVSESRGVTKRVIEIQLLRSRFYQLRGDQESAKLAFFSALTLSASCGFISLIIDDMQVAKTLLKRAITEKVAPEYSQTLLNEIDKREAFLSLKVNAGGEEKANSDVRLPDALTARELDVLQLVGKGYANKQISESLSLAPSTVKSHLNNIYSKLRVKRRTEALLKSKELGIL